MPVTHLECIEGNSSKFWEIEVKGKTTNAKYGKIGSAGQVQLKTHATPAAAKKFAEKQIQAKKKKGYSEFSGGTAGADDNDDDDEIEEDEEPAAKKAKDFKEIKAPVLWRYPCSSSYGVFVDDYKCMFGDESGEVFELDHSGNVKTKYKLPDGVKCLVGDGDFMYAGTNEGALYDLTQGVPRLMCEIENFGQIFWLDVYQGLMAASDSIGNVAVINCEGEIVWKKKSKGQCAWMVRMDSTGVYHGHSSGVTKYDMSNGKKMWNWAKEGGISFGCQDADYVYPAQHGVPQISKKTGKLVKTFKTGLYDSMPSNAVGGGKVFFGNKPMPVFDIKTGNMLYKLKDFQGGQMSMQFHDDKLYLIACPYFECIDLSDKAIEAAKNGKVPKATEQKEDKKVKSVAVSESVESTSDSSGGVVVKCIKEGGKVRVRPVSSGYNDDWNVQFPRAIRKAGKKFVVDELRISEAGGFYRAFGNIRELTS